MSEEEKHKLHDEYSADGLDDDSIRALQTISRSDRIDFEVCRFILPF